MRLELFWVAETKKSLEFLCCTTNLVPYGKYSRDENKPWIMISDRKNESARCFYVPLEVGKYEHALLFSVVDKL